jgi:hypothetical protein
LFEATSFAASMLVPTVLASLLHLPLT